MTPEIIASPRAMQERAERERCAGKRIALVPTMGFLHEGHLSLMREGRRRTDWLVVSLFVNPTQFGPNEDYARYPRDLEADIARMETVPVDAVFAPSAETMYPPGAQTSVEVGPIASGLCGAHRPGHFRGVATVVAKLFNIVKPHLAFFGEKDFQQLRVIERMAADLNFDVTIVAMPIVREADGLAMSSRNAYLSPSERVSALALSRALAAARELNARRVHDAAELRAAAASVLAREPGLSVEYVEAVDAETLEAPAADGRPVLLAIAARVGTTRLIDNAVFPPPA